VGTETLIYSKEFFWLRTGGKRIIVGITPRGVRAAGDVITLELPARGAFLRAGDEFVTIRSAQGVFSLSSPLSGQVVEVNWELAKLPELLSSSCDSWLAIFIPQDPQELTELFEERKSEATK